MQTKQQIQIEQVPIGDLYKELARLTEGRANSEA